MNIVKVISSSIKEGLRRIKVRRMGKDDIQTPYNVLPWGIDGRPVENSDLTALYARTGIKGKTVLVGYINRAAVTGLNPGETYLYGTDGDGNEQAYVRFTHDGFLEVNGNADNLVRFSDLKSAFDELKADFNEFVTNQYNVHTHPDPSSGSTGTTSAPGTSSTASVDNSKIDNVKTN